MLTSYCVSGILENGWRLKKEPEGEIYEIKQFGRIKI